MDALLGPNAGWAICDSGGSLLIATQGIMRGSTCTGWLNQPVPLKSD